MNSQQRKALSFHRSALSCFDDSEAMRPVKEARARLIEAFETYKDAAREAAGTLEDIRAAIEQEAEDEREKFDNLSEGLQNGDKGQALDRAADALDEAKDKVAEAIELLEADDFPGDDFDDDLEGALTGACDELNDVMDGE